MSMEAQLNIEIRSRILEYSLFIEQSINDLLLMNLGIYGDKEKTKLFSNKGKLTFQNKIDLLFDIAILNNDEKLEFELLMNIRNKFLHVLDCSSFQNLFQQLDNGIVNRFKNFIENDKSINDEETCKKACYTLFQKNIDTIKKKIKVHKESIEIKYKLFQQQNQQLLFYIDTVHNLLEKVSIATENSELENPKVAILGEEILKILQETQRKLDIETKKIDGKTFFSSNENMKSLFGIKGELNVLPKWEDFNLENIHKSNS